MRTSAAHTRQRAHIHSCSFSKAGRVVWPTCTSWLWTNGRGTYHYFIYRPTGRNLRNTRFRCKEKVARTPAVAVIFPRVRENVFSRNSFRALRLGLSKRRYLTCRDSEQHRTLHDEHLSQQRRVGAIFLRYYAWLSLARYLAPERRQRRSIFIPRALDTFHTAE